MLFAVLSVAHTWPLATDPAHLSRNDNSDTVFCEWIVSWVAHQAPRDPVHRFDANIFYPNAGTLAYAEHMFVPSMMGAPVYKISLPPGTSCGRPSRTMRSDRPLPSAPPPCR